MAGGYTYAVILHFNDQEIRTQPASQMDAASLNIGRQAVLDGVLYQRLQEHGRHHDLQRLRVQFLDDPQFVSPKAHHLDVQVVIDKLDLFTQGNERIRTVQQPPQNGCQLDDQLARRVGIEAYQRRYRIQRIEEEMRIDLILQRHHAGLQKQSLLLLQFDLDSHAIENLQLRPDHDNGGRINCQLDPWIQALQAEGCAGEKMSDLAVYEAEGHDRDKEHDLPVEQPRLRQIAPDPAVNAQVDKRRERPDVVFVQRKGA